jgi:phage/plasmid-associated DNA primase
LSGLMKNWINIEVSHYNGEDNFMILTGLKNGITVIDLDVSKHDSDINSISWFEQHLGKISDINSLVTQTISGGYHIYFKYCADLKTTTKLNGIPLDILNDNKGVLEGKGYTVVNNCDIRKISADELTHFKPTSKEVLEINTNSQSHSELQMRKILNGLSLTRFDERDSWIRIGYILSQYTFGKKIFKEFSKKSFKYNETTYDQQWNSFQDSHSDTSVTIATLFDWLKHDNKELFDKLHKEKKIIQELNNSKIKNDFNITSNEIVKMDKNSIDLICEYEKVVVSCHNNMPNNNCSNCDLQGGYTSLGFLLKCINCDYTYPNAPILIPKTENSVIYNILNQICINNENISDKDTLPVAYRVIEEWNNTIFYDEDLKKWFKYNITNGIYDIYTDLDIVNEIEDVTCKLKNQGAHEKWFNWISKITYIKVLIEHLKSKSKKRVEYDQNQFLLGFKNGVYDLETSEFRIGKKEEYITMKCTYNYESDYDISLAQSILDTIFPIKEEKEFALNRFTLCIEGFNREQTMTINYGYTASNGKSFLMERLDNALGDYGDLFPINLLTNKIKNAGEANTTLLTFKNKRFMYCSEPESNSKININFLKQLTGDSIKARALYSNNEEKIKATAKIFMCCNLLPELGGQDEGLIRRIRFLEYKSRFVDNPKKKNEQKLIKYSDQDIKKIEQGFLNILIENYKVLQKNHFKYQEPKIFYNIRNLYSNEEKNNTKDILDEYFENGDQNDFVKKIEIKKIFKVHNIKMSSIDLERFMISIYDCEFKEEKMIAKKRYTNIFIGLKSKNHLLDTE